MCNTVMNQESSVFHHTQGKAPGESHIHIFGQSDGGCRFKGTSATGYSIRTCITHSAAAHPGPLHGVHAPPVNAGPPWHLAERSCGWHNDARCPADIHTLTCLCAHHSGQGTMRRPPWRPPAFPVPASRHSPRSTSCKHPNGGQGGGACMHALAHAAPAIRRPHRGAAAVGGSAFPPRHRRRRRQRGRNTELFVDFRGGGENQLNGARYGAWRCGAQEGFTPRASGRNPSCPCTAPGRRSTHRGS